MSQARIVLVIAGLALSGLLVVGCGSGDDSIDKETFVERADVICKQATGRLAAKTKAQAQEENNTQERQSVVRIITQIAVPELESELTEIRALGLPSDAMQEAQTFVDSLEKAVRFAQARPVAFASGKSPAYETAELTAAELGMSSCPVTTASAG